MGMKKRKLCIILPQHWSYLMGGCEYQIKCLLERSFLQNEFDVFILSRRIGIAHESPKYRLVQIVKPYALQRYGHILDAPFLWKKLSEISPDVIYQNIGTSYAGIAALYARKNNCKMTLHIASDNDIAPFKKKKQLKSLISYIEKKTFSYAILNAHQLIAQTNEQKRIIKKYFGKETNAVIPNFQPYPIETIDKRTPIKVVWVANFKPIKQPEMFIRLAEDLQKMHVEAEFIMIGNPAISGGSSRQNWQQSLEARIKNIRFLNYVGGKTTDEVERILAESHILVNTSQYEGFSNTFIQAWMRCVPVVSLKSNPDGLLSDGKMGLISGDYEQLCKDVTRLIQDQDLRILMGKEAQSYAFKHFTIDNAKKVMKILVR
jgi:glycosyltransferase involved in cell wall biosynthesis